MLRGMTDSLLVVDEDALLSESSATTPPPCAADALAESRRAAIHKIYALMQHTRNDGYVWVSIPSVLSYVMPLGESELAPNYRQMRSSMGAWIISWASPRDVD